MKHLQLIVITLMMTLLYPADALASSRWGTISMKVGETRTVEMVSSSIYTATGSWRKDGTSFAITGQSSYSCTIQGLRAGKSKLYYSGYVTANGWTRVEYWDFYWDVEVISSEPDPIKVTSVTVSPSTATLKMDGTKTVQLSATVSPSNATNKSVTWSTSNSSVATVSSSGFVTAQAAGSATITCKANDGSGKYGTCAVTVSAADPIKVSGISLNYSSASLVKGNTRQLRATITPSNATDKTVTWSSSNSSVATVSSSGLVTAKAAGSTTITCKANDGSGVSTTCSVTVKEKPITVTKITLNASSASLSVGETKQLTATITPSNATNKTVTWSSSNSSVATVSSSGLVTAKAAGSATITCKANDGSGVQSVCSIMVSSTPLTPEIEFVSVTCVNNNVKNLTQSDKLKVRVVIKNIGTTAKIKTRLSISDRKYTRSLFASNVDEREFKRDELVTIDYELPLQDVPAGDYGAVVEYYYDWGSFSNYWMCGGFDKWAVYITIKGIDYTDISKYTNIIYSEASTVSPDSETDFIVKMKNATNNSIMGFQFDLALPTGVTVPKDEDGIYQIELSGDRTNSRKHTVASSLQSNGAIRVVCYSNNNNTFSGQDGTVLAVRLKAGKGVAVGEYPIYLRDVVMTTPTMNNYNVSEVVSKLIVEDYKKGDVNGDKTVNVVDVAGVVNLILGNNITGLNKKAADINGDNIVNVVDVAGVVNIILGQPANSRAILLAPSANKTSLYIDDIDLVPGETKEVKVNLNNPGDAFTGCQFDLYLPKGISIVEEDGYALVDVGSRSNSRKHTVSTSVQPDGAVRVVCYSNNNNTFSGEQGDILTVTLHVANNAVAGNYNLRIGNITLSRTDVTGLTLDDYSARVSIIPTGINNAWAESISNSPVFNLSGQKLEKPRKGINIIDGRKVIVK